MWTKLFAAALLVLAAGVIVSVTRPSGPSPPSSEFIDPPPGDAEAALARTLPGVRLEGVPFDEAVGRLRELSGANIVIRRRGFETVGFDCRTPVEVDLHHVTLAQALGRVLKGANADGYGVGYAVRGGVIVVSGYVVLGDVRQHSTVRAYDVRDLIGSAAPPAPELPMGRAADEGSFGGSGQTRGIICARGRREAEEVLTELVLNTVSPGSWRETGGAVGSIRVLSGNLVITQLSEGHQQLEALLAALRSLPASESPAARPASSGPYVLYPNMGDAEGKLGRVIPRLRLASVPFPQAVAALREATGANIWVNWPELEEDRFDRKNVVEVDLRGVTLAQALEAVLAAATTPPARTECMLDYAVEDGIIVISEALDVSCAPILRAYWVGDLIEPVRSNERRPPGAAARAGARQSETGREPGGSRAIPVEELERMLEDAAPPDSWIAAGARARIYEPFISGWMIVEQTWANHRNVEALLSGLRVADRSPGRPATGPAGWRNQP